MVNETMARVYCNKFFAGEHDEMVLDEENTGGVVWVNTYAKLSWYYKSWSDLFEDYVQGCILEDFANIGKDSVKDYLGEDMYILFTAEYGEEIRRRCA